MSDAATNKGYGIYADAVPQKPSRLRDIPSEDTTSSPSSSSPKQFRERQQWRGNKFQKRQQNDPGPDPKSCKIQTPENPSVTEITIYRLRGWIEAAETAGFKIDSYGSRQKTPEGSRPINPYLGPGYLQFDAGARDFDQFHAQITKTIKKGKKISSTDETIFSFLEGQKRKLENAQDALDDTVEETLPTPGM